MVDHPDGSETLATTTTANPSLKLKINLRDRQSIRKRHRSSSPASSDSSSTTHGSTRSRHLTGGPPSSLKRNRKEIHQRRRADELSEEPDTPPPSNGKKKTFFLFTFTFSEWQKNWQLAGSPAKRNEDVKKVIPERRSETVLQSNILLVDMNGDDEEEEEKPKTQQIPDPSGSPPESPVEEEAKTVVQVKEDKLESPQAALATSIVKRLTRDVKNEILLLHFHS